MTKVYMYACLYKLVCLTTFCAGATPYPNAYFGEGNGPIHLDYVLCSGTEYNVTECKTENNTIQTAHSQDVGVKCQPGVDTT